jgi:hypothetical protein
LRARPDNRQTDAEQQREEFYELRLRVERLEAAQFGTVG